MFSTNDPAPWFVEGRSQGAGTSTGWGEGNGFRVNQMAGRSVSYGGVANLRSVQMIFTFSLEVDWGSQIHVTPPHGVLLACSTEGALKRISLPGGRPDCVDDPLQLRLTVDLTAGVYAFGIAADMPPETPQDNTFDIAIKDRNGNVVDAAYQVPGKPIVDIGVTSPTLSWSRADAGQPSVITIGVTFVRDTISIKALLINFPERFIHDVQKPTDVQNLNRRFPVAAGQEWADTTFTDRIKIFLDDSDDITTIAADSYRFNFPVRVPCCQPSDLPKKNIWFLSLCRERDCTSPEHRSVVVSFPMAGFGINELAPDSLKVKTSFAEWRSCIGKNFITVLSLFCVVLTN